MSGKLIIIDDDNYKQYLGDAVVDGQRKARGLVPRDYSKNPKGSFGAKPFNPKEMPLIPRSEWSDRIKEGNRTKSFLSHLRRTSGPGGKHIPSLDQNGQGYCWNYSAVFALMMARVVHGFGYERLSAHAGACVIKNFRDDGGWSGEAIQFLMDRGCPTVEEWPEKSMNRRHNTDELWAKARARRITESWIELDSPVWDRDLTFDQLMTCLLNRIPCPVDYNWWGHSVCALDPVEIEPGSFGIRPINSWTDNYGDLGEFVLRGQKAIPDNAAGVRVIAG